MAESKYISDNLDQKACRPLYVKRYNGFHGDRKRLRFANYNLSKALPLTVQVSSVKL